MIDIALIGHMRAGKDSVAAVLTREFGYKRAAFADALKDAALEIDPQISSVRLPDGSTQKIHLYGLVNGAGWDVAKDRSPETRRFLQNLGHSMRSIDPEIWIHPVLDQIDANWAARVPTVVTDVRYENEAETLREEGFTLVRVVRPGAEGDSHVSETELDDFPVDRVIVNDGSLEDLAERVRWMIAMSECA